MTTLCIICSVWRAHSTSCWLTSSGKRDLGGGGDGMTQQIKILVNFGCTCRDFFPNISLTKKHDVFFHMLNNRPFLPRVAEFSEARRSLSWELWKRKLLSFIFPHVTWMHHETAAGGEGGSVLLPLFPVPRAWQQQHLRALFPCSLFWCASPSPSSPSSPAPYTGSAFPPPSSPRRPSLAFAVWSPLHEPQLPAVGSNFFFFALGGVCGVVMNLQGTHTDSGQGRDTFIYTENETVWEREKGGEPATVKLIRTSCV